MRALIPGPCILRAQPVLALVYLPWQHRLLAVPALWQVKVASVVLHALEHGDADDAEEVEEEDEEGHDVQEHGQGLEQRVDQSAEPWDRMDATHGLEDAEGSDEFQIRRQFYNLQPATQRFDK